MLVLFILAIVILHHKVVFIANQQETIREERAAAIAAKEEAERAKLEAIIEKENLEQLLEKGEQIERSIENIDSSYFKYDPDYKRHTLKGVSVEFHKESANIEDLSSHDRNQLLKAGQAITKFLTHAKDSIPGAEYLLIVEGQSSKDPVGREYGINKDGSYNDIYNNNVLSYRRAHSLVRFWRDSLITFSGLPCEVIISGSGTDSPFRDSDNTKNQRFVIHIIPKPGILSANNTQTR